MHAALRGRMPLRIAGHHGLIPCIRDPFSGALRPTEQGAAIVREMAGAIPPDTLCVSHDFAALLAADSGSAAGINWIGELQAFDGGAAIGLYALKTAASPQKISSSSRCGATTTSLSASRRMMPRRSSALTAREAVSRVVETCSARSATTGAGRMARSALCRARRSNSAWTRPIAESATCSYMRDWVCCSRSTIAFEQGEADAAMLLGEQGQHIALEQEGGDLVDRDHVGVVDRGIRRADHAEEIPAQIFVQQHDLPVERIDDRMRAAGDDDVESRDPVALANDRGCAPESRAAARA